MTGAVDGPPELPAGGVECPACGKTMRDTGRMEMSDMTKAWGRIMGCPHCANESLFTKSPGKVRSNETA